VLLYIIDTKRQIHRRLSREVLFYLKTNFIVTASMITTGMAVIINKQMSP